MYRFDDGVDRVGTDALKWDMRGQIFGRDDVIPLWVADMDFAAPQEVIDAMVRRAQHGAFGYTPPTDADFEAVIGWMRRRHATHVEKDAILLSPGVVDSQRFALSAIAQPGDKVIICTPVYGPFFGSADFAGCEQIRVPLLNTEHGWFMDFDGIEAGMKAGAKAFLLCNPHNPVGRVWTEEEIRTLMDLAHRYGVKIISDEIHADLEMPGHKVTSILRVDPDAIALISATKTFNLAALRQSQVLIPNKDIRAAVSKKFQEHGVNGTHLFGLLATTTAYKSGDEWLDELLVYLDGTRKYVQSFIAENLPRIKVSALEGTYLMWLDMRALGMDGETLFRFLVDKAGVGLSNGTGFGQEGEGFMRLNIATPRKNVIKALDQIRSAIDAL